MRTAVWFEDPVWLAVIVVVPGGGGAVAGVVTVKSTVVWPARTVAVAETVPTVVSLLDRLTTKSPVGAAPEIVMVPVEVAGCITLDGLSVRLESVGGFTVSVALMVPPPTYVAKMCAIAVAATGVLVTVNVVELKPAGTVTVLTDGFATTVLSLATLTVTPPVGAVVFNVIVAVGVAPPITLVGLSPTDEIAGGFTVSDAVCCMLL